MPGKSPRHTSMNMQNVGPPVPPRTETPEKLSFAPLTFRAFPLSAGGLRPEGPRLRRARRAPCLFLPRVSHARGSFRVGARARLLFSRAGKKLSFCSLRPGRKPAGQKPALNFREYVKRGAKRSPTHRNARKAELCSFDFSGVSLASRTCVEQVAHRVCSFAQPRPHAAGFGCGPNAGLLFSWAGKKLSFCSLRPGGSLPGKSPRQTSMNTQNVGPPVPQLTETPEKLSFAPWLFGRFPASRRFAARRAVKPASNEKEGESGERVQASPFAQKRLKS